MPEIGCFNCCRDMDNEIPILNGRKALPQTCFDIPECSILAPRAQILLLQSLQQVPRLIWYAEVVYWNVLEVCDWKQARSGSSDGILQTAGERSEICFNAWMYGVPRLESIIRRVSVLSLLNGQCPCFRAELVRIFIVILIFKFEGWWEPGGGVEGRNSAKSGGGRCR